MVLYLWCCCCRWVFVIFRRSIYILKILSSCASLKTLCSQTFSFTFWRNRSSPSFVIVAFAAQWAFNVTPPDGHTLPVLCRRRSMLWTSSGLCTGTRVWGKTSFPSSRMECRLPCWASLLLFGLWVSTFLLLSDWLTVQRTNEGLTKRTKHIVSCSQPFVLLLFLVSQVRNSSTLLFSTLITRIFGVKKGKDEHSKKNRLAAFPSL